MSATEQIPAVDAAEPVAAVDAVADGTPPAAAGEQPTGEIAQARAERDASKRARRDAEARADALAARVAELEPHAAEVERLRGELTTIRDANRQERTRAVVQEIEQAMSPSMRGNHVAPLVEAFAQAHAIDLGADGSGAVLMTKLRAHSPGLFVTPSSSSHQSPPGFAPVI